MRTSFHPAVNDALGLLAVSANVDWADPATLHNGFYPFGIPAIMAALPSTSVLAVTSLLSLAGAVVVLLATWAIAARLAGRWWALAAVVLVSVDPQFLAYAASPGPDLLALAVATAGLAVYAREATRRGATPRLPVIAVAGLLLGLSGLFRYHAVLLALALLAWTLMRRERRWTYTAVAAAGVVIGFLPQVVINLLGGFGPLESDSAFTMYQSAIDINWHATGAIDPQEYASPLAVIRQHPWEFTSRYLESLGRYALPIAALAVAVLVQRRRRDVTVSLLIGAIGYSVVVATGNSPRGLLGVLPLAAIAVAVVADAAMRATRRGVATWQRVVAVVSLLVVAVVTPRLAEGVSSAAGRVNAERARAAAEETVRTSGLASTAAQVLTNDFDLYFADLPGINPDRIGGWTDISLNGRTPHTDVDITSIAAFACDATTRGIRVVLWSPGGVPGMDPTLEAALNGASTSSRLKNVGAVGSYVATLVQPGYDCP